MYTFDLVKNRQEEIIYKQHVISRVLAFAFFYWVALTALMFLPLCVMGTAYCAWQIIHSIASPVPNPGYGNFDNWLGLLIGGLAIWWILRSIVRGFRSFIKPVDKIEGIILDKEEREFDEGRCYYIFLKPNEKIEINEQSYNKLIRGNRVSILWSNKIDQPMKIVRVKG